MNKHASDIQVRTIDGIARGVGFAIVLWTAIIGSATLIC